MGCPECGTPCGVGGVGIKRKRPVNHPSASAMALASCSIGVRGDGCVDAVTLHVTARAQPLHSHESLRCAANFNSTYLAFCLRNAFGVPSAITRHILSFLQPVRREAYEMIAVAHTSEMTLGCWHADVVYDANDNAIVPVQDENNMCRASTSLRCVQRKRRELGLSMLLHDGGPLQGGFVRLDGLADLLWKGCRSDAMFRY